jgi:septal ring factor EnvC (AmiA/AmiB activator)
LDWKHFRRSPLSGIVALVLFSGVLAADDAGRANHVPAPYDREISRRSDALDSIRTEIESRRAKIRELERAEGGTLDRLEYLEANIAASKRYLLLLSRRIDSAGAAILLLKDSLSRAGTRLADRHRLMRERLRRAYMEPRETPLMAFFMARSPAEAVQRTRGLEAVHAYDRALAERIDREQRTFNTQKEIVEKGRAELAGLLVEKTGENDQLVHEQAERRAIVRDIRSRKKSYLAKIAELETARKKLDEVIRMLEQRRKAAPPRGGRPQPVPFLSGTFEKLKGDLPWPIDGPVLTRFGKIVHPVYKTVITSNGIDIGAAEGGAVRCIAAGSVLYTGSMRGLGKLVIVDHGGGYLTIYAGLRHIEVSTGQTLEAGTVLGRAGGAGDTGGPKVHFEIRKSTDSLDPQQWLARR